MSKEVCSGGVFSCKAHVIVNEQNEIRPFATPSGLGPADLVSAYKLNPAITSTATIAIVDAFHYANAASDLATYRSTFGLPPCTVASGCLTILNPTGAGGDDTLTGRTLRCICLPPKRMTEAGTRPSHRPVSIRRM